MLLARYQISTEEPRFGWILDDHIGPLDGSPFAEYRRREADMPLEKVRLLAPVEPGKIICVATNYASLAREQDASPPQTPVLFLKPPSAIIPAGAKILIPPQSRQVEHGASLAIVIRRRGRWISAAQALNYVLGYTAANDITARDLLLRDGLWARGKGFDTFCPLGPWIQTELDAADTMLACRVNGEIHQMASTHEMIFPIPQIIAYASSVMTLAPGDVILTGTPGGVSPVQAGDILTVSIEGIGDLRNPVAAESAHTGIL